jgi:hypothetical protein
MAEILWQFPQFLEFPSFQPEELRELWEPARNFRVAVLGKFARNFGRTVFGEPGV